MRRRHIVLLASIYAGIALLITLGLALLGLHSEGLIAALVAWYVLPESWDVIGSALIEWLWSPERRVILVASAVAASSVLLSALFFPLKERLSRAVECCLKGTPAASSQLPLWQEGFQELRFVLVALALQLIAVQLILLNAGWASRIAGALSICTSMMILGLDHIAPLLQRRSWSVAQIILAIWLRRPLPCLLLGAAMGLPLMFVYRLAPHSLGSGLWLWVIVMGLVVGLVYGGGAIAGCLLAAHIAEDLQQAPPCPPRWRMMGLSACLLILLLHLALLLPWLVALHRHSQLLKLEYLPQWRGLRYSSIPSADPGTRRISIELPLLIRNPSPFHVQTADLELSLFKGEQALIQGGRLPGFALRSQATQLIPAQFEAAIAPQALQDPGSWSLQLRLQTAQGPELRFDSRKRGL